MFLGGFPRHFSHPIFASHPARRPTLARKAQEKLWRAKQLLALAAPPSIVVLVLKHTCL
jgi:hypothetical protein